MTNLNFLSKQLKSFPFFALTKGARDQKKSAKEEQWLKQIEQQAMKDYRAKDLQVQYFSYFFDCTIKIYIM